MQILRANLDDEQFEIGAQVDRSMLVLAPPGSGKTRLLTNAAAHRLRSTPGERFRICCLTFSVEAAREMRKRLADKALLVPTHRLWVGNFHQLGASLLSRWGHLIDWPRNAGMLVPPEQEEFIERLLNDLGIRANARSVATAISNQKGRREGRAGIQAETLHAIWTAYEEALTDRHLRDFDDLIVHTLRLLREQPKTQQILRDTYHYVFVDELQDTNQLQLDLIAELVGERCTVLGVADDDQMIYAWRDARPENVEEFERRFGADLHVLKGNYRCPPAVVNAANAVIAVNERRRDDFMESRREDIEGEVTLDGASGREAEAEAVVRYIIEELDQGTSAGEIVVMAPQRFWFTGMLPVLDRNDVPYVVVGTQDLISVPAVRALRGCLNALSGGTILAEEIRSANRLADEEFVSVAMARNAVEAAKAARPRTMLDTLVRALGLGSTGTPTRDADAIRLLARMTTQATSESEPGSTAELARVVLIEWNRLESAALRAEQKVKIMTCYAAKGTEYEVVILPFMNDGMVPYEKFGVDWDEARRVFYVALTRSKRRVVLTRDTSKADSLLLEPLASAFGETK